MNKKRSGTLLRQIPPNKDMRRPQEHLQQESGKMPNCNGRSFTVGENGGASRDTRGASVPVYLRIYTCQRHCLNLEEQLDVGKILTSNVWSEPLRDFLFHRAKRSKGSSQDQSRVHEDSVWCNIYAWTSISPVRKWLISQRMQTLKMSKYASSKNKKSQGRIHPRQNVANFMGGGSVSPPTLRRAALASARQKMQTVWETCQPGISNEMDA